MPVETTKLPIDLAAATSEAANRSGVDSCLLAAIAVQESNGNTWAVRHEPTYRWLWNIQENKPFRVGENEISAVPPGNFPCPAGTTPATEWIGQRTSWGACQVMGATARELGFVGTFLSELCDPIYGMHYGAQYLARLLQKYDVEDAISAYNAGHPTTENYRSYVLPIILTCELFRREGF